MKSSALKLFQNSIFVVLCYVLSFATVQVEDVMVTNGNAKISLSKRAFKDINDVSVWQTYTAFTPPLGVVPIIDPNEPVLFPDYFGTGSFLTFTDFFKGDTNLSIADLIVY